MRRGYLQLIVFALSIITFKAANLAPKNPPAIGLLPQSPHVNPLLFGDRVVRLVWNQFRHTLDRDKIILRMHLRFFLNSQISQKAGLAASNRLQPAQAALVALVNVKIFWREQFLQHGRVLLVDGKGQFLFHAGNFLCLFVELRAARRAAWFALHYSRHGTGE